MFFTVSCHELQHSHSPFQVKTSSSLVTPRTAQGEFLVRIPVRGHHALGKPRIAPFCRRVLFGCLSISGTLGIQVPSSHLARPSPPSFLSYSRHAVIPPFTSHLPTHASQSRSQLRTRPAITQVALPRHSLADLPNLIRRAPASSSSAADLLCNNAMKIFAATPFFLSRAPPCRRPTLSHPRRL